jgi:membrane-associated protease RseP (regulator of RpoE activity)
MLRQLLGFTLLAFSSCTIIYSQKTPEPAKKPATPAAPQVFNFYFEGGSYLGIEPQEVTRENFSRFGLSSVRGVAVEKVVENSPAASAGLQPNDVIIRFEGEEVTSVRKLTRLMSEVAPDHQVKLTILRGGSEQEITATMGKREMPGMFNGAFRTEDLPKIENLPDFEKLRKLPEVSKMPRVVVPPDVQGDTFIWKNDGENTLFFGANRQIGASVTSLSKQLGEYFGVPEGRGLLVNNVRENSPAAKAGLRAGDVIVEADGKEVKNNADLIRTLNEKKEGDVTLTIIRDRNRQTVRVTPEKLKGDIAPLFEGNFPSPDVRVVTPQMQVAPFTNVKPATPMVAPVMPGRVL